MDLAIVIALLALVVAGVTAVWQKSLARHANSVPVLIDLFREHRSEHLAGVRALIYNDVESLDLTKGMKGVPKKHREDIRDLLWFYDNLGVLVVHDIVDIRPVSGYLGGAAALVWKKMEPLILSERRERATNGVDLDPDRWQHYFEMLVEEVRLNPPADSRRIRRLPWTLAHRKWRRSRAARLANGSGLP